MLRKYPKWISEFKWSIHQFYHGMDLRTLEPLDCFHFHPLYSDLWVDYIYQAIRRFKRLKLPFFSAVLAFPNPSSVRAIFEFMVCHHHNLMRDGIVSEHLKIKEIFNFLRAILKAKNKRDIFCYRENIGHGAEEINKLVKNIKWQTGSPAVSRSLGRLYLGASSLVNGLMNDWCTDNGIEVWGPYMVSRYFGKRAILAIREFPRLKPTELWLPAKNYEYKEIKILTVYKNIKMRIEFVGCHTVYRGDLAKNLVKFAVLANGKNIADIKVINKIADYLIGLSKVQYQRVKKLGFEALKRKIIAQEFYQLKDFFRLVGMDCQPPQIFIERIRGRKLLTGRYPLNTAGLSLRELDRRFGINDLKRLYSQ